MGLLGKMGDNGLLGCSRGVVVSGEKS
jgi:hypothetical protein